MTTGPDNERRRRLAWIEDRKIEILMEIGEINREYDERLSRLGSEYDRLTAEYYGLRLGHMKGRGLG
jgi:hypothetical protein